MWPRSGDGGKRLWDTVSRDFESEFRKRFVDEPNETLLARIDEAMPIALGKLLNSLTDAPIFAVIDELNAAVDALETAAVERDAEAQRVAATDADTRHLEALRDAVEAVTEELRVAAVSVVDQSNDVERALLG